MIRATWIVMLVACSSPAAPPVVEPKPQPKPADCEVVAHGADAYDARRDRLYDTLGKGRQYVWDLGEPTPETIEAARKTCADADADIRFLCVEGLAQGYGAVVGAQHVKGTQVTEPLRKFPERLGRIDTAEAAIHCRGLGAGLNAGGVTAAQLVAFRPHLEARCMNVAVEGFAARLLFKWIKVPTAMSVPTDEMLDSVDLDKMCEGLEGAWCAFGAGRALGNLFPGKPEPAIRGCRGTTRGACISGIAYVAAYLWDPEDLGHALGPLATLSGDDRAAYVAGIASALQWQRRASAERVEHRLACLPETDRARVQKILKAAETCGAFDFKDGKDCRWSDVP